ncbi:hypothetical protein C8Q77DRAFT_614640 [Trametes polyzona]|nr:hypothetical protein C8Q77DRAFT_614640 [Trametes polyzona]
MSRLEYLVEGKYLTFSATSRWRRGGRDHSDARPFRRLVFEVYDNLTLVRMKPRRWTTTTYGPEVLAHIHVVGFRGTKGRILPVVSHTYYLRAPYFAELWSRCPLAGGRSVQSLMGPILRSAREYDAESHSGECLEGSDLTATATR